jgi:hypothetical protein
MARPVVLIYQETAAATTTPEIPDLNCLVVGPAYWIKDYLDDKSDIQTSSDYGTKEADNAYSPPAAFTDAVTVTDPPSNKAGAVLDASSVNVYFDECRVLMGEDTATPTTGAVVLATGLPHNIIDCSSCSSAFKTAMADMKAGDYVIIENTSGSGDDLVKRVQSVVTTGGSEAIYTTTNFTAGHATTKWMIRVEREVDDVLISSSFVTITSNKIVVNGGVTTVLSGESASRTVNYAKVYIEYRSLRQDLSSFDSVSSTTEAEEDLGINDARNPLSGVVHAAMKNTTTKVQYYGVLTDDSAGHTKCMEAIEGRTDVYAIVPVTVTKSILQSWQTEVERLASVTNASTYGIPQKFRVVIGAQTMPTEKVISPTSSTGYFGNGVHATVDGAINNTTITGADTINVFVDDAATFVTDDVRANDKLVIVSDTAGTPRVGTYTIAEVYGEKRLRTSTAIPGTTGMAGNVQYYIIRGTGTPVASTSFTGGDVTAATDLVEAPSVTGVAGHVGDVLRISASGAGANVADWLITALTAAGPPAQWTVADPSSTLVDDTGGTAGSLVSTIVSVTVAQQATSRRPFRVIKSATATHITDGVKASDNLQIPNPISGTSFSSNYEHEVAFIPTENDIILAVNEDAEATDPEGGDTDLTFRVGRDLDKDDIVDELVTVAQGFDSKRVVLVWPDEVIMSDLKDGSKTRSVSTTPEQADAVPGYYLGGVVGGMTAGLPSHQGFTFLSVDGVDSISHSTRYFSDEQMTELSDGGWFVFAQDTTSSDPYCIHQLTTDPSTLDTGEYSVVKNFDFVSLFFQDILDDFLGVYNINDETLGLLKQTLNSGIDILKLRKYAKIGAPLNAAEITEGPEVSTISADRVEIYMDVYLPKPLNRIGLHLISK